MKRTTRRAFSGVDRGGRRKVRGSVMIMSVVMLTLAGFATVTWLNFTVEATRAAGQDRSRLHAFYAAEAGVEQVVDFFNNPNNYQGEEPGGTEGQAMAAFSTGQGGVDHLFPESYGLFEPYILEFATDSSGNAILDPNGDPIVTRTSYFEDLSLGSNEAISATSKIPTMTLDISWLPNRILEATNGNERARIDRIRLINPSDLNFAEEGIPANMRVICMIVATGATPDGARATVRSLIAENMTYDISSPGAIISRATATYDGNFSVHWGELWAQDNVDLASNWQQKIPTMSEDPWFMLRTEGVLMDHRGREYADGRERGGFASTPIAPGEPVYEIPFHSDYLYTGSGPKIDSGYDNLRQNQSLEFPHYPYEEWKSFVRTMGYQYYFTDTDGVVYGEERDPSSANFGQTVGKSFDDWFGASPSDANYDEILDKVVFVDSVPVDDNGNPAPKDQNGIPIIDNTYYPRNPSVIDGDPAARMAEIKLAGGGLHTRGAMFVAANLDMKGQGNPPSSNQVPDVVKPNFQPPDKQFRIFHNGFLHVWGSVSGGGNRTVYGSIYAERGYASNGTPEVYYNIRMRDGSWLNLNTSRVRRMLWNVIANPDEA